MDADLTMDELRQAVSAGKGRAAGPDGVLPDQLKRLPEAGLRTLLALLNRCWREGVWPARWKEALIVPILKKGKDAANASSYRPVSLLCVAAKAFESIIKRRLQYWAELRGLIPSAQSGFQPGRSASDCVLQLAQHTFDGLSAKPAQRSLIVALDMTSAFDQVWRGGLLADLCGKGLPRRSVRILSSWLQDRRGRVRWNHTIGPSRVFTSGTPQGSPLSPLLFALATAELPGAIQTAAPDAHPVIYADDLTIRATNTSLQSLQDTTQSAVDAAAAWAQKNYLTFAPQKSTALLCTNDPSEGGSKPSAPSILLGGVRLPYGRPQILGVLFDPKVRFGDQARAAAAKMATRNNILWALAGTKWGSHPTALRDIYRGFVEPAGLFAAGAWLPFVAPSLRDRLQHRRIRPRGSSQVSPAAPLPRRRAGRLGSSP